MSTIDGTSLEIHLQKICKSFITLENNEKRLFTQHFNKVYKHVTNSMGQVDDFFKYIFQEQQLAGSYADRIKVGQPNEYDALMILKLPDPVVEKSKVAGYVTINIKSGIKKWSNIDERKYKDLLDEDGYVLQDKVLGWLRKLIYDILNECNNVMKIGNNEYVVRKSSNGPAVTLDITIIKSEDNTKGRFSIDFVGALAFDFKEIWFGDRVPQLVTSKRWNAIVKPNKKKQNKNRDWACSYADIEREYIRNLHTLKQLIRIFKKIRDNHNLTNLKSYFIKVIFLHERINQKDAYWKQKLGVLFMTMFDVILKTLERRELFSFWHNDFNLLSELSEVQITDIFNKLKKIKENIEKNLQNNHPEFILSVILSKNELDLMSSNEPANSMVVDQGTCEAKPESRSCTVFQQVLIKSSM